MKTGSTHDASAMTEIETFVAPWPAVLAEIKDYLDLWFLAGGGRREAAALRVFISRPLVARANVQPHAREFKTAISRLAGRVELRGTDERAHRIEIEYRRGT
jgi:hypothetical protein